MNINPYINFNGNCREALDFYSKVFEATPNVMTYSQMPEADNSPMSEETKNLIIFADLEISGSKILFCDTFPDMSYVKGTNVTISISSDDESQLRTWFERLSGDGEVVIKLTKTFWSKLFGFTFDKFGIGWQINYSEK